MTIQIKLSVRQLGAELLRRLGGALLLFVGTFTVNAIPYLWPDVFWASGSGLLYRNLLGLANVLLVLAILVLIQRKSGASLWEYGLSLALTALLLSRIMDPVGEVLMGLLESGGASFEFAVATVYFGPAFALFWTELELIALALGRALRLFRKRQIG